jgi:integrase/recombinase XerD
VSLAIWRRHSPAKCKLKGRQERKCRCPIWISGVDEAGNQIKETTRLRDWTRAEALARHWDNTGAKPAETPRTTIEEWKKAFLADAESPAGKNLAPETLRLYKGLFKQLDAFAEREGYRFVNQLDLSALTAFRSSWNNGPLSASKKLERLRGVLRFALRRKWVLENPAVELDSPNVQPKATLPFTDDEMKKILKAAKNQRVHAFILVMRYSGLRISDTATLAVDALTDNRLRLRQTKTGEPVSVLLPNDVAKKLRKMPHKYPKYFFWSGSAKVTSVTGFWRAKIAPVFTAAKITNGHTHRFRDTFAVDLLQAGVSLENVSTLLGHKSIRITEKHYSPWVKTRQDALDREIMRVHSGTVSARRGT